MKKYLTILLALCIIPIGLSAAMPGSGTGTIQDAALKASGATVAANQSEAATFIMQHTTPRVSVMSSTAIASMIDETGSTTIGTLTINNNTRDGFKLFVGPEYGALVPIDNADGEVFIPYSIEFDEGGTLGIGMESITDYTVPGSLLRSASNSDLSYSDAVAGDSANHGHIEVLAPTGAEVSQATSNLTLDIDIVVDASESDKLGLAGTYNDTLTFTYVDL
jgi:hypothetical protein